VKFEIQTRIYIYIYNLKTTSQMSISHCTN